MQLYNRAQIESTINDQWKKLAYNNLKESLTSKEKLFPCTLGVAGFSADQLRFGFIDEPLHSACAANQLAALLQSFLPNAKCYGKNTSLVVFFNETTDFGVDLYENKFWKLLNDIHQLDSKQWAKGVLMRPEEKMWEFSFGEEPIFVVCNTPSHQKRHSRNSKYFMITFQPRWVFDGVIGKNAPNSQKIKSEIRRRLSLYDELEASPCLGSYGDEDNREWMQYFLLDNNSPIEKKCPFDHAIRENEDPKILSSKFNFVEEIIDDLIPPTGSIEIQFDTPSREHNWHTHPTNETLHMIKGEISFYIKHEKMVCRAGDRLLLPANTMHRSIAGAHGCLYAIATRIVYNKT